MIILIEWTERTSCSWAATLLMCSMLSALRALNSAQSVSCPLITKCQPHSSRSDLMSKMAKAKKKKVKSQLRRMITCSTE